MVYIIGAMMLNYYSTNKIQPSAPTRLVSLYIQTTNGDTWRLIHPVDSELCCRALEISWKAPSHTTPHQQH